MASALLLDQAEREGWSDEHVVHRVLAGETPLYEILMRRHNQRLFRVTRAILHDDAEAEDVIQETYVRAYEKLASFEGRAKFSTWLIRIAVYEAFARSNRRTRFQSLDEVDTPQTDRSLALTAPARTPEQECMNRELTSVLQEEILKLPENYRLVFIMRDVEGMSTAEVAECLSLSEENIKVRLHRARALLRRNLRERAIASLAQLYPFLGTRCDNIVSAVFQAIAKRENPLQSD